MERHKKDGKKGALKKQKRHRTDARGRPANKKLVQAKGKRRKSASGIFVYQGRINGEKPSPKTTRRSAFK